MKLKIRVALYVAAVLAVGLSHSLRAASPPVFSSPPTASPSTAGTGESITFTVAATGSTSLLYMWNFGDATTSSSGALVHHKYNAPGTYSASVTVTDFNNLSTTSSALTITVVAPLVSSGPTDIYDSDGDGFSNLIESDFNTDSNNSLSTPAGNHPATAAKIATVASFSGKFKLDYNDKPKKVNSGKLTIAVNVPDGFSTSNLTLGIDIGGIVRVFTLDSKGKKAKVGKSSLSASIRKVRQKVPARQGGLTFSQLKMIINLFDDKESGVFSNDWIDAIDLLRPPDDNPPKDIKDEKVKAKLTVTASDGSTYTLDVDGTFNRQNGQATITYSASGN